MYRRDALSMASRRPYHELNEWLDRNGYHHAKARPPEAYLRAPRIKAVHARVIHQEPTGRAVFAAHERNHHITTSGRRALESVQFALPPGPEEKRRGIKGRLPIDTLGRAQNALARASMMHLQGHLTTHQLATVREKVHRAWPSIKMEAHAHKVPFIPNGRSKGMRPSAFDPAQLAQGAEHELEHTTNRRLARQIAMDHLAEDPLYYVKLARLHD